MNQLFTSATLKLTGWYLLILMAFTLLFSAILFQVSTGELRRGLRAPLDARPGMGLFTDTNAARGLRDARYDEGVSRLLGKLVVMNAATFVAGGGLSYVLARRTLRPIHEALVAQTRFTSDASHELRTPLTIMQSEIEVGLRNKQATKQDYAQLLQSNLDEVDRLRELSDRLLQLAGARELPREQILLDDVAIDAVSHIVKAAQQRGIRVENEVRPLSVYADRKSLADALTVLLDNAVKYSPEKTTVVMRSEEKGRSVLLHVIDSGPGVAETDMPHIFDRFYRADVSRSRQTVEGHGLGLSIAKRIVEQHQGQLSVQSRAGEGATFTIRLPRG